MQNEIFRRGFIRGALAIAVVGVDSAAFDASAEAASGVRILKNGKVETTIAKVPALAKVGGVALIGNVKGAPVALVHTSTRVFKAINLACTHQGATVGLTGARRICPRHGSEYALNGTVKAGPAQTSLATLRTKVSAKTATVGR